MPENNAMIKKIVRQHIFRPNRNDNENSWDVGTSNEQQNYNVLK